MLLRHLLGGCTIFNGCRLPQYTALLILFVVHNAFSYSSTVIDFSLRPHFCLLSEKESVCAHEFIVEWKVKNKIPASVCLFQVKEPQPVFCWQEALDGKTAFSSNLGETTRFELRDMKTQDVLAQDVFEVAFTQKKYQRERRNPWSFF